jgi:hypothetical protein
MKKTTKTTKAATTNLSAVTTPVETKALDFEHLRRTQTKPLKAEALEEFVAEYKEVNLEPLTKYPFGFSIIIDEKKFGEIWAKTDVVRFNISKRNLVALEGCTIALVERTALKKDRDSGEELTVETEFVLTREEVHEILALLIAYAKQKTEEKKSKAEPKAEEKKPEAKPKAKKSKAKKAEDVTA